MSNYFWIMTTTEKSTYSQQLELSWGEILTELSVFMRLWCQLIQLMSSDPTFLHFRMTKNTFEVLSRELAATGAIPTGNRFGRKPIPLQKQILAYLWYTSNMEVIRSVSDRGREGLEGLELVSKLKNGQMEHKFPFGIPDRENGSTFSDVPFISEIFRWDEPKWRVPFTAQPKFPGFFCKW